LLVEALGAMVIATGIVLVIVALARHMLARRGSSFIPIRLSFSRYLALALELQLAADILSTSIAPTLLISAAHKIIFAPSTSVDMCSPR
jgi:uncharacterized membrane protein